MEFEWDENKRQINIEKHGIDFADAEKVFGGFTCTVGSRTTDYGEKRYITIGVLNEIEVTVIHTPRGSNKRIISMRRARIEERKAYNEAKEVKENGDGLREIEGNE